MRKLFTRLKKSERGATAIEYGLIAALVALGAITGMSALGDGLSKSFTDIKNKLDTEVTEGAAK